MKLKHKVAVVTGGGNDIARATALLFSREGAAVLVAADSKTEGNNTIQFIKENGGEASLLVLDFKDPDQIKRMMVSVAETYNRLDVIFNSSGTDGNPENWLESEADPWDMTMAASLHRIFLCCKYGIPELLKNEGGVIINEISTGHLAGMDLDLPGACCAFQSAKSAIAALTNKIAYAYGPENIRACVIFPEAIKGFAESCHEAAPDKEQAFIKNIPLRRRGDTAHVAEVALFLASENAAFVSGTGILVDGGYVFTHRGCYP